MSTTSLTNDDVILAGELALRVLAPEDERAARVREAAEPAFAREVDRWNDDLARLADEIAEVAPSAALWPAISARLFGGTAQPANDNNRLAFWRTWALGSTGLLAASVVGLAVLAGRPDPVAPITVPPVVEPSITRVATVQLESGQTMLTLAYDPATGRLYLAPAGPADAEGRVPHLWLMSPDGGVRLVGAVGGEAHTVELDAGLRPMAGEAVAIAVSMEAAGTTPALDAPAGPVVGSAEFSEL